MPRYHIKKDGTPGVCHAEKDKCPLGGVSGEENHFDTRAEAQAAIDKQHMNSFAVKPVINTSKLLDPCLILSDSDKDKCFSAEDADKRAKKVAVEASSLGLTISNDNPGEITNFNSNVRELNIPRIVKVNGAFHKITSIGKGAFQNSNLTSVSIPESVDTINDNAFEASPITHVIMSSDTTTIGNNAFANCKIKDIKFVQSHFTAKYPDPKTGYMHFREIHTIGNGAFKNNKLENVHIEDTITTIGDNAFANNNLTKVKFDKHSKMQDIHKAAFKNNQLEGSLDLPEATDIYEDAFANNNLTKVNLPHNACHIHSNAFANNKFPKEMHISLTTDNYEEQISPQAFGKDVHPTYSVHKPAYDPFFHQWI